MAQAHQGLLPGRVVDYEGPVPGSDSVRNAPSFTHCVDQVICSEAYGEFLNLHDHGLKLSSGVWQLSDLVEDQDAKVVQYSLPAGIEVRYTQSQYGGSDQLRLIGMDLGLRSARLHRSLGPKEKQT